MVFIEENKIYQKINSHEITQIIMEDFKEGITQGISSGINHLVKDKQNENSSVECYWGWVDYMAQLFRLVTKNTRMHFHPKKHIFLNIEYELIRIIMGFVVRLFLSLILH